VLLTVLVVAGIMPLTLALWIAVGIIATGILLGVLIVVGLAFLAAR
jgi:hypothetical protein